MKRLIYALLIPGISMALTAQAQISPKRLFVKSGHLETTLTGTTSGTRSIWFKDYGRYYCEELKTSTSFQAFGQQSTDQTHSLTIYRDNKMYQINLLDETGYQIDYDIPVGYFESLAELNESKLQELGEQMFEDMGGEKLGTVKILGFDCDKIKLGGIVQSSYKGLVFNLKIGKQGDMEKAVSFDENIAIPDSKFDPPSGISWQETEESPIAFADDEDSYNPYNEEDDEVQLDPVTYPYKQFEEVMNAFRYEDFISGTNINLGVEYLGTLTRNDSEKILIAAFQKGSYLQQLGRESVGQMNSFTHSGRKMHFSTSFDEEMQMQISLLVIEYPERDLAVSVICTPAIDKSGNLRIADQLKF